MITPNRMNNGPFCCFTILALFLLPALAWADRDLSPERGGTTYSLGMPPVYKGRAGLEIQSYRPQDYSEMASYFSLGVSKDLGSPVVGIAGLRIEGYGGYRNQDFDGGGRALFEIPSFYLGAGVDYNGLDEATDFLFQLDLPLRRGGIFGRGSTLAFRWLPTRDQTFSLGVNLPLWGRNIGATRPSSDNVRLQSRAPRRLQPLSPNPELSQTLTHLGERAGWVARLSQPFAEPEGADAHEAMAPVLSPLQAHIDSTDNLFPDGHTLTAEIQAYHQCLDLAFSLAAGSPTTTERGQRFSAHARDILLEEVLIPYNYLLGQRKKNDSLISHIAIAQTRFAAGVMLEHGLDDDSARMVFLVFQTLCDLMEENRQELLERWDDSRFVWLPLHYALKPDQHDSQTELDDIIARCTQQPFTEENQLWYVINEEFQWEMARSVRKAEDYHVLWIHDYRGLNGEGKPDEIAYVQTLNYLEAMIERVEAYDREGKLPQYFILLDQHYFEINKARLWLRLLSDPLGYDISLPDEFAEWETRLDDSRQRLQKAVDNSILLQLGLSQFGDKWLKNRIKVHVNITNPADPSFFSWHIAGILAIPDNLMRDHRKIAFYDISEEDPYRGKAMFTGMGIGEHYVGANWEDRALIISGPGALEVKDAARNLLVAQGFAPEELPFSLRYRPKPVDYQTRIDAEKTLRTPDWMGHRGSVMQLHNETGFHDKPVNVAKAVLYSLMPPGSVLKVPDSLWQSYIYASLLAGSAQRGCKVLVIAPTRDSAPSGAAPTLARAHGLMGRLIVFSSVMEKQLSRQDGLLKVGLYAPQQEVADIAGRMEQAMQTAPHWMEEIYPDNPRFHAEVANTAALLDSLDYQIQYLTQNHQLPEQVEPKIHLKANFFASGTAWQKLVQRPELAAVIRSQIEYMAKQASYSSGSGQYPDVSLYPEQLADNWSRLLQGLVSEFSAEEQQELIYYLSVGSTNMDYRSMVMDGEVMILVGGYQSLNGLIDFMLLPGLCQWAETTEELDALLPPPGALTRALAGLMKLAL